MKVRTAELAPIIKQFINTHNLEHPRRNGGNQNTGKYVAVVQGRDYICRRAGIGHDRLQNVIDCKKEEIDFKLADKIAVAMDMPGIFQNDVRIIDDPALLTSGNESD